MSADFAIGGPGAALPGAEGYAVGWEGPVCPGPPGRLAYAADSLTGMAEGSSLLACVTSAAETRALLAAVNATRPALDWTVFDQGGRLAATGDTAATFSGVSSAA